MTPQILISPNLAARIEEINIILSKMGIQNPHPDLLYFPADSKLGITEARKIKEHLSFKPTHSSGKAVVLEDAGQFTVDTQNALLKILEEPPPKAIIILGASSDSHFLPTILSRCQITRLQLPVLQSKKLPELRRDIEKLFNATVSERFTYIEKLKDREEFLEALIGYFHHQLLESDRHERSHLMRLNEFLKELLQAQQWAKQNVNIRAILEYLMLIMPKG